MRGCGRIQRAILKVLDDGDAHLYSPADLAKLIYHGSATSVKRHAVVRAAQSLARKYPEKFELAKGNSGDLLRVIRRD